MRGLSSIAKFKEQKLILRLTQPEDAAYIQGLRSNPAYNTHLAKVTGTVYDQQILIENYKSHEALCQEFYYVIEQKDCTLIHYPILQHMQVAYIGMGVAPEALLLACYLISEALSLPITSQLGLDQVQDIFSSLKNA